MIYYDIITLLDSPAIPRKIRRMLQNPNVNNDMTKEKIEYVINKLIRSNNNAVILPPYIHPSHYNTLQHVLDSTNSIEVGYTATIEIKVGPLVD